MNSQSIIEQFVATFEFSDMEQKQIAQDILDAINVQTLVNLSSNPSLQSEVRQMEQLDEQSQISMIRSFQSRPEFAQAYGAAFKSVIVDWTATIAPTLDEARRQTIGDKLTALEAQMQSQFS